MNWLNGENEHEYTTQQILDYRIVRGFPGDVEKEVKMLLEMQWDLHGEMYTMKAPGEKNDIVVQCMVLYKDFHLC